MQGSAVALPPALFSAPPHLIFEEQFEFVPEYPEITHHAPLLFSSNWRTFTYLTYVFIFACQHTTITDAGCAKC